jgi:hypothetical protein
MLSLCNFLGCNKNIIGNLKPTLRLEASLPPVQRGLSPISFSINTMARFYENKEYEMVSSAKKNIYWAWSHKEDQFKVLELKKHFYEAK